MARKQETTANLNDDRMSRSTGADARRRSFVFFNWGYMVVGAISIGIGLYLAHASGRAIRLPLTTRDNSLSVVIAVVLILFGIARIVVGIYNLIRLKRASG